MSHLIKQRYIVLWIVLTIGPLPLVLWEINLIYGIIVFYILMGAIAFFKVKSLNNQYHKMVGEMWGLAASGHLNKTITVEKKSPFYYMQKVSSNFADSTRSYVSHLKDFLSWVISSTSEICIANNEMEKGYTSISSSTMELKEMFDSSTNLIHRINKSEEVEKQNQIMNNSMSYLKEYIDNVKGLSTNGVNNVNNVSSNNEKLSSTIRNSVSIAKDLSVLSESISEVLSVINDIADKINLLSLNASIEAARAGDAGKGFAVVADEIGKLADQTTSSTKDVSSIIEETSGKIQMVIEAIEENEKIIIDNSQVVKVMGGSFDEINKAVKEVYERFGELENAFQTEISIANQFLKAFGDFLTSNDESSTALTDISAILEEQTAAAEEIASQVASYFERIKKIDAYFVQFKI